MGISTEKPNLGVTEVVFSATECRSSLASGSGRPIHESNYGGTDNGHDIMQPSSMASTEHVCIDRQGEGSCQGTLHRWFSRRLDSCLVNSALSVSSEFTLS